MNEYLAKNRAVLVHEEDYHDTEFMLWMYDLRILRTIPSKRYSKCAWIMFRCSDAKYTKLYEKMDSLGIWRGDITNPKLSFDGEGIDGDTVNICDHHSADRYLVIGV